MNAWFKKTDSNFTLGVERRLSHPPAKVWRVLTERDLLRQWFPCDVEGEWQVGSPLQFTFLHGEGEGLSEDELRGEVLAVTVERLLEFRWGTSLLRIELTPDGDGCKLLLTESLDDPAGAARNAAGWEMCLENLIHLAEGTALCKFVWEEWRTLFERYVKRFEPKFGPQMGPPENHEAAETEEA